MIDQLLERLQQLSDVVSEQANSFGESAKEKSYSLIEDWITVFPKLEANGLLITSFGMGMGLSPSVEVEMRGKMEDFSKKKIDVILKEHKANRPINTVFKAIQTTLELHDKIGATCPDPVIVKVKVQIPPEVRVILGTPIVG